MTQIATTASVSKHEQIAGVLRARIKTGEIQFRLPNRQELSRSFDVNFKTVCKALNTLQRESIVVSRRGLGVFVHPRFKEHIASECFYVFPGHKAITDQSNKSRHLLLYNLEHMLSAGYQHHVELRLLPIAPTNDDHINWTLLTHLKENDYAVFLGLQYWNVIRELRRKGCRCLVLNDNPLATGHVSESEQVPVMSFDIDFPEMMTTVADHLSRNGYRHLAAVGVIAPYGRHLWQRLFTRLSDFCRQRRIQFAPSDIIETPASADALHRFLDDASRSSPNVDSIFAINEIEARQIRDWLDQCRAAPIHPVRIITLDNFHTWQESDQGIDALRKPQDEMIERAMQVVCGERPFQPGHVPFRAQLCEGSHRHAPRRRDTEETLLSGEGKNIIQ